jgi:hypothetical protein
VQQDVQFSFFFWFDSPVRTKYPACQATRHTWQTAHQVAVAKGLVSAAQHRKRHRPIVLTVHNVTTARDLQETSSRPKRTTQGAARRTNS